MLQEEEEKKNGFQKRDTNIDNLTNVNINNMNNN